MSVQSSPPNFRTTLAGFLALAIAMGVGRFAFTPILPLMQEERLLMVGDGGFLASVHFLGYWLGAASAAKLSWPPKNALCLSLFAIAAGTLAMGCTDSFALWLAFRFLCGWCSAITLVFVSKHTIMRLADAGHAHMQGWVFSGVGAGIALAGLGMVAIMSAGIESAASWQTLGTISLVGCVIVCSISGSGIADTGTGTAGHATPRAPLAWTLVFAYGVAGVGYIVPATYLPLMAREAAQSPLVYGWSWPLFGAAAFLSTLISARLHAFWTNRHIWAASQSVMAFGLLLPAFFSHIAAVTIAGLCVGGTFMMITMAGMREAHRVAPAHDVQRHIAVMTTAFATGQIIGPLLAGWAYEVTKSFSFPLAIISIALVGTAAALTRHPDGEEQIRR